MHVYFLLVDHLSFANARENLTSFMEKEKIKGALIIHRHLVHYHWCMLKLEQILENEGKKQA